MSAALVFGAAAFWYLRHSDPPPMLAATQGIGHGSRDTRDGDPAASSAVARAGDGALNAAVPQGLAPARLIDGRELATDAEPWNLLAFSAEEAAWLAERGYPTADEWRRRLELPLDALDRRIAAGDVAAMVLKGTRLALSSVPGEDQEAERLLNEAKLRGSPMASEALALRSAALMLRQGERPSLTDSAYIQVELLTALMMGDYWSIRTAERLMLAGDNDYVYPNAAREASASIARINAERARRGWAPLTFVQRPGADAWREAMVNGGRLTEYPRR